MRTLLIFIRFLWALLPLSIRREIMASYARLKIKALDPKRATAPGDIVVAGLFGTVSGLGEAARQLVARMRSAGIKTETANLSRVMILEEKDGGELWSNTFTQGGVLILFMNPNLLPFAFSFLGKSRIESRHVIGIWYWELQTFPKSWERAIASVDELWAGSNFVAEGLRKIAGSKPVHVIPLPLDVTPYLAPPTGDPLRNLAGKTVVFFMYDVRSTHARKNPDGVLKAFQKAVGDDPNCALVIKINNTESWPESEMRLKTLANHAENIHFLREKLSSEDMKNLMARVDIVMSLHRAEGFGLLMAEAMAAAKPVIATGWSANTDFMTPACSVLIDYTLVPIVDDQHGYDGLNAKWAEPNIDQAANALRRLIASPDERKRLGEAARRHIIDYLSPQNWGKTIPESFWQYVNKESRPF